jgi:ATP-dependent RNA helicase RhlE
VQVEESVKSYSKYLPVRSSVIYGGMPMDPQVKALQSGVEILVATPGRLLDHVNNKTVRLGTASILVLDEADRMLDMGFIPDIKRILQLLPADRQTLLFSATFSNEIKRLADDFLTNPVTIEVARSNQTAELVEQRVYSVPDARKKDALVHLIREFAIPQAIVFCGTKQGANKLCSQLIRDGIHAAAIHSDKTQQGREESLNNFKAGEVKILVATDIAARGLDVEDLPYVFNYDLPHVAEDYVHRIGRTGRAGSTGHAFSFVAPDEERNLREIEKLIKTKINVVELPQFQSAFSERERPSPRSSASSSSPDRTHADTDRSPRRESSNSRSRPRMEDIDPMAGVVLSAPSPSSRTGETARTSSQSSTSQRPGRRVAEVPALLRGFMKAPS